MEKLIMFNLRKCLRTWQPVEMCENLADCYSMFDSDTLFAVMECCLEEGVGATTLLNMCNEVIKGYLQTQKENQ